MHTQPRTLPRLQTNRSWSSPVFRRLDADGPTERPYDPLPADFADRPILGRIADLAAHRPGDRAIEDGTLRLSYGALVEAARSLAKGIVATTPPGDSVAVLLPNSGLYPVAALACLAAGRPYVALDARVAPDHNFRAMAQARCSAVLVQGFGLGSGAAYPAGIRILDVALAFAEDGTHPWPSAELPEVDVDAPAIILYTSGSTGSPKAIVNGQRALLQRAGQQIDSIHAGPGDVFLPLSAMTTIAGTREWLAALLSGATLRACDPRACGLAGVRRIIREREVSVTYAVPALFRSLVEAGVDRSDFASLRVIRLGGDKILWRDVDLFEETMPDCDLQIGYSSTETTGTQWFVPRGEPRLGPFAPVGHLLPGLSYRIRDDEDRPVAPGEIGELVVKSPFVALGLWEDGQVVPHDVETTANGERIIATGDLVSLELNGMVRQVARKDRMVKVNGQRVEPAELESALRDHPGVRDAAVIVRQGAGNAVLVAFVAGEGNGLERALRDRLRAVLPSGLHPARIYVLAEIPRLTNFKLDALALERLDWDTSPGVAPKASSGSTPRHGVVLATVERAWCAALGQRAWRSDRSWDEAGGDSLGFMRLLDEVERTLGCVLRPASFRLDMRPAEFAGAVEDAYLSEMADLQAQDERPIVFLCPGTIGDGPALVHFRAEVGRQFRLVALRYLDWQVMTAGDRGIEAIADDLVKQIDAIAPTGDIRIAGYSFGGPVAVEAAALLAEAGRKIAFLGILDSCIAPIRISPLSAIRRALIRMSNGMDTLQRIAVRSLVRHQIGKRGPGSLHGLMASVPARLRFTFEMETNDVTRTRVYKRWVADAGKSRVGCRLTLFRSEEARPGAPRDLGWSAIVDDLVVVDIQGTHLGMMMPRHRHSVVGRFVQELTRSVSPAPAVRQ